MTDGEIMAHCPIKQVTADGYPAGRCWYHLSDGKTCPTHGDVAKYVQICTDTGRLTSENTMRKDRGQPTLPVRL
jgi:hypothetical protein